MLKARHIGITPYRFLPKRNGRHTQVSSLHVSTKRAVSMTHPSSCTRMYAHPPCLGLDLQLNLHAFGLL